MNGLASNGAVVAYAKLIGASASAEFLMERRPLKKIKNTPKKKNQKTNSRDLFSSQKLWLVWGDEEPTGMGTELFFLFAVHGFSSDQR